MYVFKPIMNDLCVQTCYDFLGKLTPYNIMNKSSHIDVISMLSIVVSKTH